jgi:hypothetical protein
LLLFFAIVADAGNFVVAASRFVVFASSYQRV